MRLPTGTVTFLFTDIEGSTRILQEAGEGFGALLDAHAVIIREHVTAHGGRVISTEGDSYFCVFTSASSAVAATAAFQLSLTEHEWPSGMEIRVRAGLHTGEGRLRGDDYVGLDVNRAARVSQAGHGGQILLTNATRELVRADLPEGVSLHDLGRQRLKDLAAPEHLFQLIVPGVASVFPPLRSIDARPNNLPADVTSFVGRVAEITAVRELLARHRLVTLTGPGGTGKTRLGRRVAWEALGEFDDGAWFVDLSPIVDAGLVASAIGQVLEVREQPDRSLVDALKAHLADRRTLFVLDNLEQVTAAGPLVADLLASASGLRVLATSRVPLHIYGEQEYPVLPLAVPHVDPDAPVGIASLVESEAVRLFIERARAARPDLRLDADDARAVAEICARLDGLPLAIELAAARVKLLPPRALLERLDHRLTLLASTSVDLPPRQRTLRGAIDWSYDLLDEPDRELFARLAVFRGGFTLGTAESVAAGAIDGRPALEVMAGIESLLDKSLLRASQTDHAGEVRIAMLETIREYALERLAASGAEDAIRRRHAETFRALAEEAEPHLTGADLALWLDRLTHEHDDIRAALSWAIETGEAATGLRIGYAVWRFWQQRGHLREGRDWLSRLVRLAGAATEPAAKGRALIALGGLAYWQHDYDAAGAAFDESRRLGESVQDASLVAEAAYNQAWIHAVRGENDEALQGWRESQDLYRALGDELSVARAAQYIGLGAFVRGDLAGARAAFEEEITYFERTGRKYELGDAYVGIAETYQREGLLAEARRNYDQGLSIFAEAGNLTGIAMALQGEASVAAMAGQMEAAVRLGAAADRLEERLGGHAPRELAQFYFGEDERARARAGVGGVRFEQLWREGRELSPDAAIALLSETPIPEAPVPEPEGRSPHVAV